MHSRFDMAAAQSFNERSLSTDPEDPENKKFFNKELTRKTKEYSVLGAIAGIFIGVANGMQRRSLVRSLWSLEVRPLALSSSDLPTTLPLLPDQF